ncbi:MAG: energy-coupling factor transporter transmembrane protein EcfT [Coriobacteriales bacterium]|nr:energy-coupling factor transporter transmembrane protein EcfT [Coriobacteriales bacterium]
MAYDIAIGQYYHSNSLIHRLDPRIKVTLLFASMVAAFLANTFIGLGILMAFLLLVVALSNIPLRTVGKAAAPLSILLVFPLLFNVFFVTEGTQLAHWGLILITDEGLWRGLFMMLRLFVLFFCATLLTLTTSPIALCDAMGSMLRPFDRFGLPSFELSMMMSIALRFIPTLLDDFDKIKKAQLARGAVFDGGGPIARLKALVPLLVPLFAQSFRHAEDLAYAMESRCYHGGANRTHYHALKIESRDYIACAVVLILIVVMVFL